MTRKEDVWGFLHNSFCYRDDWLTKRFSLENFNHAASFSLKLLSCLFKEVRTLKMFTFLTVRLEVNTLI